MTLYDVQGAICGHLKPSASAKVSQWPHEVSLNKVVPN